MRTATPILALQGGLKAVTLDDPMTYHWPIVTQEDERAVIEVLRAGTMSGTDITRKFESEFAGWLGVDYALCCCNGTSALLAAMYGCEIGCRDEIIGPAMTYWAAIMPAMALRATPVLADIDPATFCIDPDDIERRITQRTKAIVVVHQFGYPCDMDRIMAIAERHSLKVIEDVSHAQGGLYKGRRLGTIGDVGATSLMSGKSFAIGEGGILVTHNRRIWERAIALGHYERTVECLTEPDLAPYAGLPFGGYKLRINQTASAMGRVQLRYYDERAAEIRRAMNRFWDLLAGCPGLRAHRVDPNGGSNMGGWYHPVGIYVPEELGGLPIEAYAEAVRAEGGHCNAYGGNASVLHLHPVFQSLDVYAEGKPTSIAHSPYDQFAAAGSLPHAEQSLVRTLSIPWFKHDRPQEIEQQAAAYRKVAENSRDLLK